MLIKSLDIIKQSLILYKNNWRKFVPFLILLLVPTIIISVLAAGSLYLSAIVPSSILISSLIVLAVIAASIIFTIWATIVLNKVMHNCLGEKTTKEWREAFSENNHLVWPVIATSIIVFLIVLGGTILLVIPGIIFSVWYVFVFYTVIFENKKGMEALAVSKKLVTGRWWSILWRLIVPGLIFGISAAIIIGILNKILNYIFAEGLYLILSATILNSLINVVVTPLTAGALLILYLNAKKTPISTHTEPPETK